LLVAVLAVVINAHSAGSRHLLEDDDNKAEAFWDDTKSAVSDAWGQFYGGQCTDEAQCADVIATCKSSISKYGCKTSNQ